MDWIARGYHDDRCFTLRDEPNAIRLYLFEGILGIPIKDIKRVDESVYRDAMKQLVARHDEVFIVPDDEVTDRSIQRFRYRCPAYIFRLHDGLLDDGGWHIDESVGYKTVELVKWDPVAQVSEKSYFRYISYEWHLEQVEKAKDAIRDGVASAVRNVLQEYANREIFAGATRAKKRLLKLNEQIKERRAVLREMDRLIAKEYPSIPLGDVQDEPLVYFIREPEHTGLIKIGKANNLRSRLPGLGATIGPIQFQYDVVHVIYCDKPEPLERYLHRQFADKRRHGEWFALTPGDVNKVIRKYGNRSKAPRVNWESTQVLRGNNHNAIIQRDYSEETNA